MLGPICSPRSRAKACGTRPASATTISTWPSRWARISTNGLWRLQSLLPGTVLTIPLDTTAAFTEHRVSARDDLARIAATLKVEPWSLIRDNALWDEQVREGMVLRVRPAPPPKPAVQTHRVRSGENLTSIARRYSTTVRAIQAANSLGGRTLISIGQRLDIPTD